MNTIEWSRERVRQMSVQEIMHSGPPAPGLPDYDREEAAERERHERELADAKWIRDSRKALGLPVEPEPFNEQFAERLAATFKRDIKFWGEFFRQAVEIAETDHA